MDPDTAETLEVVTEPPEGPESEADRLDAKIKEYYWDAKVDWGKYPRLADWILDGP